MLIFLLFFSFDEIAAIVENRAITEKEVAYLSRLYPGMSDEELLERMIMGRVILSVAKEETIVVNNEDVINEKERIIQGIPGLQAMLSHPYIDSLYTEELRVQLYMRKLIQSKFQGKINISPTSVRDFYEANKDSFSFPSTVTLERLDVPVISDEDNRLLKLAQDIINQFKNGANFGVLAREYSDDVATKYIGGKLGKFKPEDLPPHFMGVLQIPEGEVELFESPRGYHIVHLIRSDIDGIELEHILLDYKFEEEELQSGFNRTKEFKDRWMSGDTSLYSLIEPMGQVPIKALGYPLSSVIDTLDVGEISEPILEGSKFHLLRVAEKTESTIPHFSDVKDRIRDLLYQRELDEKFRDWFANIEKRVYLRRL
jgi:parvulin-like peptidyl-prolyl isomerase